jgi:hypothetical protein
MKNRKLEKEVMGMFDKLMSINQGVVAAEVKRTYLIEQAIREQYGLEAEPPRRARRRGGEGWKKERKRKAKPCAPGSF